MNPQRLLDKAKIGLMQSGSVFLCTIAFNMNHRFSTELNTAGTNGLEIVYNPDWFGNLTSPQRTALLAHETWHVALSHMLRRENRDPEIYNRAGDYVINQLLVDDGFELPPNGCQDNKFRGMSTKQVYDIIKEDTDESPDEGNQDIIYAGAPKEGKGNDDNKNGSGKSPETFEELEAKIKRILVKATTQSKMSGEKPGSLPSEIDRMLDTLINPKLPWHVLLQRFLTEKIKDDYSWSRPNRRFMPDFYLPTQNSEALANITIAIDTSGSVSDSDMIKMLSEIEYIRSSLKPKNLTIIDCDCAIHNVFDVSADQNILDLQFSGQGGTSVYPVFDYCDKNPTTALIYFTDLYCTPYKGNPTYPVLWIVYDNPNAQVEVGEITHYDIEAN